MRTWDRRAGVSLARQTQLLTSPRLSGLQPVRGRSGYCTCFQCRPTACLEDGSVSCPFDNPPPPSSALGGPEIRWVGGWGSWSPSLLRHHVHAGPPDSAGLASRAHNSLRGPENVFIPFKTRVKKRTSP